MQIVIKLPAQRRLLAVAMALILAGAALVGSALGQAPALSTTTHVSGDGISVPALDAVIQSWPEASLPSAGNAGRLAFLEDNERGLWVDSGSIWSRITGVVSVRDFGAVGDNSTNDRAAILLADAAATAANLPLYFPGGYTYRVVQPESTNALPLNATTIIGDGYRSHIYVSNVPTDRAPILRLEAPTHLHVEGLRITQVPNTIDCSGNGAIHNDGQPRAQRMVVTRNYVENFCGDAVVATADELEISFNTFENNNGHGTYGGGPGTKILGNHFINIGGAATSTVTGVKAQGFGVGGATAEKARFIVEGNVFDGGHGPSAIGVLAQSFVDGMVISNNVFKNVRGGDVNTATDTWRILVTGNVFVHNASSSVIRVGGRDHQIVGNIFDLSNATGAAVEVIALADRAMIADNHINAPGSQWPVTIGAPFATVRGNYFNSTRGIQVSLSAYNWTLQGNHFQGTDSLWYDLSGGIAPGIVVPDFPRTISVAEDYSVRHVDDVLLVNATSAAVTIYLPDADFRPGREIHIYKVDTTANAVTVQRASGDLINDLTSQSTTTAYAHIELRAVAPDKWAMST